MTILTRAGCKRYCKTQRERIFRRDGNKKEDYSFFHVAFFKAGYNYRPFLVASINFFFPIEEDGRLNKFVNAHKRKRRNAAGQWNLTDCLRSRVRQ